MVEIESDVDALIGYTGFVGGNLMRQHRFGAHFNSANVEEMRGRTFRTLVHAGTQAKKWWANQHPDEDWRSIESALLPLRAVRASHVVLISTIDVLPLVSGADETFDGDACHNHAYGSHRLRLEREISTHFPRVTIVRLPALFGPGLKKNIVYDLINQNMLEKINPDSRFQYYDLHRLWADIERAMSARLNLVHLVTEPLATSEIVMRIFPECTVGSDAMPKVEYDFRTRHAELFEGRNGYIATRSETLHELRRFVDSEYSLRGSSPT
jgi:hypothetical protein